MTLCALSAQILHLLLLNFLNTLCWTASFIYQSHRKQQKKWLDNIVVANCCYEFTIVSLFATCPSVWNLLIFWVDSLSDSTNWAQKVHVVDYLCSRRSPFRRLWAAFLRWEISVVLTISYTICFRKKLRFLPEIFLFVLRSRRLLWIFSTLTLLSVIEHVDKVVRQRNFSHVSNRENFGKERIGKLPFDWFNQN